LILIGIYPAWFWSCRQGPWKSIRACRSVLASGSHHRGSWKACHATASSINAARGATPLDRPHGQHPCLEPPPHRRGFPHLFNLMSGAHRRLGVDGSRQLLRPLDWQSARSINWHGLILIGTFTHVAQLRYGKLSNKYSECMPDGLGQGLDQVGGKVRSDCPVGCGPFS
jgi:hypothetical protein